MPLCVVAVLHDDDTTPNGHDNFNDLITEVVGFVAEYASAKR